MNVQRTLIALSAMALLSHVCATTASASSAKRSRQSHASAAKIHVRDAKVHSAVEAHARKAKPHNVAKARILAANAHVEAKRKGKKRKVASKPKPPPLDGPPLPADRQKVCDLAYALVAHWRSHRLALINEERDGEQLITLGRGGVYDWSASPSRLAPPSVAPPSGALPPDRGAPSRHGAFARKVAGTPESPHINPPPPPSPKLLRMLESLAAHSTEQHPLVLLSLLRPPYQTAYWRHCGPGNPHSLGMAADIAAFEGHQVASDQPNESVRLVLALLRRLPPGEYRLGLPKAPQPPLLPGTAPLPAPLAALRMLLAPDPRVSEGNSPAPREGDLQHGQVAKAGRDSGAASLDVGWGGAALGIYAGCRRPVDRWPFFPPPEPEIVQGVIAPLRENGRIVLDGNGAPSPHYIRFRNEAYAPESEIGDKRLQTALKVARKRGVGVVALFPDAEDHVHIDVHPR